VRSARRRLSVTPLALSVCNRYRPTVDEFLEHAAEVRARSGWDASFVHRRVERIRAVDGGFEPDGRDRFAHVLLTLGHPGLDVPPEFERDVRAVHAYEPHEYADQIEVIGAGMAAATEWLNALAAGASVVSVRRREPERRPLNLPRPLFTRRGLASFHRTAPDARVGLLRAYSAPSYPPGRGWDEPLRSPRFRVRAQLNGAEQIICATGFKRGFTHDPLLRRLADENDLETADRWIVLAPDSTVPALTDETRTLALAGVQAQWAFPAADTLVGAKYGARGFLGRVQQCRTR
jgi:hypothetical protein